MEYSGSPASGKSSGIGVGMVVSKRRGRRAIIQCAIVGAAAAAGAPTSVLGATRYYVGPSGSNWNTATNWSTIEGGGGSSGVPANLDTAYIRGSVSRTVNYNGIHSSFERLATLSV